MTYKTVFWLSAILLIALGLYLVRDILFPFIFAILISYILDPWADKLEERNILVRPAFDLPGHLRVTVGLPVANQAFVEALATLMAEVEA